MSRTSSLLSFQSKQKRKRAVFPFSILRDDFYPLETVILFFCVAFEIILNIVEL